MYNILFGLGKKKADSVLKKGEKMVQFKLKTFDKKPVVNYNKGDVILLREVDDGSFHYLVEEEIVASFTDAEYRALLKAGIATFGSGMLQGELMFHMFTDAIETLFHELGKENKVDMICITSSKFKQYFLEMIDEFMDE